MEKTKTLLYKPWHTAISKDLIEGTQKITKRQLNIIIFSWEKKNLFFFPGKTKKNAVDVFMLKCNEPR